FGARYRFRVVADAVTTHFRDRGGRDGCLVGSRCDAVVQSEGAGGRSGPVRGGVFGRGVAPPPDPGAVLRPARPRHRAGGLEPAEPREACRHLSLRRLRSAAVLVRNQVRERHGLAELLGAARRRHRHLGGPQPVHDPDRGALPALRRPSRPRVRGRAAAHGPALLHERGCIEVRPRRRAASGQRLMKPRLVPALAAAAMALVAGVALAQEDGTEAADDGHALATFAGGCFWCMEPPYDELDGVLATTSGYMGGHKADPTYHEVSAGSTGHAEAVQITYDPSKVSYQELLEVFWRNVDPLDAGGQFCDRGDQYRTAIFVHDEEQRRLAEASKEALEESGRFDQPIVTAIEDAGPFYPAEEYHQDYYE